MFRYTDIVRNKKMNVDIMEFPVYITNYMFEALFSTEFRALIVLFSSGYNIETCNIIEATFRTLHFLSYRDFSQVKGGHGPSGQW